MIFERDFVRIGRLVLVWWWPPLAWAPSWVRFERGHPLMWVAGFGPFEVRWHRRK